MPTSTRRALLIGAPTPDLRGVGRDLELMSEALRHHGFDMIELVTRATRELVDAAFARLISATQAHDVVAIYYSGHGATIKGPQVDSGRGEDSYYRFLVFSDFESSTDDDFRGYTNIELSLQLERASAKTRNVVVIMDCCFAGRVFRGGEAQAHNEVIQWQDPSQQGALRFHRAQGRWGRSAQHFYERLQSSERLALGARHSEANPFAVQLLASAAAGKAYEVEVAGPKGEPLRAGAMTIALHKHLMSVDPAHTTWQDLGRMLRMAPRRAGRPQVVSVEGPYRRLLFQLDEREPLGALDVDLSTDQIRLAGGRLAGLVSGDTYELVESRRRTVVGRAKIDGVESSYATVTTEVPVTALDTGSYARQLRHGRPRAQIELVGFAHNPFERELVSARLEASGLLAVHETGDAGDSSSLPVVGQLRLEHAKLRLWSGELALDTARSFAPDRDPKGALQLVDYLVDVAHRLARVAMFRKLHMDAPGDLDGDWELSWARVESGSFGDALAKDRKHVVGEGEQISVKLRAGVALFVSVFVVRADAGIELVSRAQGSGVQVKPGESYYLGQRSHGPIRGLALERPPASVIPGSEPLPSTLLAIVSDDLVDLRSWEQRGIVRFKPIDPLTPESDTRTRSRPASPTKPARYRIETLNLWIA